MDGQSRFVVGQWVILRGEGGTAQPQRRDGGECKGGSPADSKRGCSVQGDASRMNGGDGFQGHGAVFLNDVSECVGDDAGQSGTKAKIVRLSIPV